MMKTKTGTENEADGEVGSASLVQNLRGRPALRIRRGSPVIENTMRWRQSAVDDQIISRLFQGYFNNKMTLLLFLVQSRSLKPNPKLVESVLRFLNDLFHHMLAGGTQKQYRLIFKWLSLFFRKLPDVSLGQRDKAKGFIRVIYDAFGLCLKSDI